MSEPSDWIQFWPTAPERRRAAARAEEVYGGPTPAKEAWMRARGLTFAPPSIKHVAAGYLLEEIVERWLGDESIPYVRNGGVDDLPDFEIGARAIAVKNRVGVARGDVRHTWPTVQALRPEMIFGINDRDDGSVWIMGAISERDFLRERGLIRRGEDLVPGYPAKIDNWTILTSQLVAPLPWLQDVYVDEVQHAA